MHTHCAGRLRFRFLLRSRTPFVSNFSPMDYVGHKKLSASASSRLIHSSNISVGAQLIIWGDDLLTDYSSIVEFCARLGFDFLEAPASALAIDPPALSRVLEANQIALRAVHVGYEDVASERALQNTVQFCRATRASILIVSGVTRGGTTETDFLESAATLNSVARICGCEGLHFYYHTMWREFGDKDPIQHLLRGTDPHLVKFNLDVCWAQAGGVDPASAIDLLGDRCDYYHIKDGDFVAPPVGVKWKPLGMGETHLEKAIAKIKSANKRCSLVIEQDEPLDDPYTDMKTSYRFLMDHLCRSDHAK